MWGAGDLVLLAAIAAIVAAWMRTDVRRSEQADARAATSRGVEVAAGAEEAAPLS
jgi:hypothetical protein